MDADELTVGLKDEGGDLAGVRVDFAGAEGLDGAPAFALIGVPGARRLDCEGTGITTDIGSGASSERSD